MKAVSPKSECERRRCVRRTFTLIEILAAMGVLVVLMGLLFNFLSEADQLWSITETNSRIYERAQIAFEVIGRDLQSAVASNVGDREIPFFVGKSAPDPTVPDKWLVFVATVEPIDKAESTLCEIGYDFHRDATSGKKQLRRWRECDRKDDGTANADWDFFGQTSSSTWATNFTSFSPQVVIDGVEEIKLQCFNNAGPIADDYNCTELPKGVRISLTLYDPKLKNAPDSVRKKSERMFSKFFFLGGRQQ